MIWKLFAGALAFSLSGATYALAADKKPAPVQDPGGVSDAFGFTDGADVTDKGKLGFTSSTFGYFGKRGGVYRSGLQQSELAYGVLDGLHISLSAFHLHHRIRDAQSPATLWDVIDGNGGFLDNRNRTAFSGLQAQAKYQLLKIEEGKPFGLALQIDPGWSRLDGGSGAHIRDYALGATLIGEAMLIANRLYAAVNIGYAMSWTLPLPAAPGAGSKYARGSEAFVSASLSFRILPNLHAAIEARAESSFDGLALKRFQGHGYFIGPSLYWKPHEKIFVQAAWNAQVGGHARSESGRRLNFDHYERHRVRLKIGIDLN